MERGSLEVRGLEFRKNLHHEETVTRNCGSGGSFPGQGSTLYEAPELAMALASCRNLRPEGLE